MWLLKAERAIYLLEDESGQTLPTWSSQTEAEEYSTKIESGVFNAVFFPMNSLFNILISQSGHQINSVAASPKYGFQSLTYLKEEYLEEFNT